LWGWRFWATCKICGGRRGDHLGKCDGSRLGGLPHLAA
jgi:hypothetical protein